MRAADFLQHPAETEEVEGGRSAAIKPSVALNFLPVFIPYECHSAIPGSKV